MHRLIDEDDYESRKAQLVNKLTGTTAGDCTVMRTVNLWYLRGCPMCTLRHVRLYLQGEPAMHYVYA